MPGRSGAPERPGSYLFIRLIRGDGLLGQVLHVIRNLRILFGVW
jgi:hypothetical protein